MRSQTTCVRTGTGSRYDLLGQVTNGTRRWTGGQAVAGQSFAYSFDDIGNRKWTDRDGDRDEYTANALNQYTERSVTGVVWVTGSAHTNASVQVNGVAADRKNAFFSRKLTVDNSTQAMYSAIEISGIGSNGATIVTNTVTGHVFTPQSPEALSYDLDGNLTNDSRWAYFWDAENRLISMETHAALAALGVPRIRLTFTYDSQSRRVRKQVFTWQTYTWVSTADYWFAYDGWNMIHEERRPDALARRVDMDYVWGLDLSGSMQGAGGIGGLLSIKTRLSDILQPVTSFACYDANGNVKNLVDSSDGLIAATYEYSPFGECIQATGPIAQANPFRFSTKYVDPETGLIDYTFRYYSPSLGRWINRDPIEESGGWNVHGFGINDPVNTIDVLGLAWVVDRNYGSEAYANCDCNDTVRGLAQVIGLDPARSQYEKWLWPVDGRSLPATADEKILRRRRFKIPNEVHITQGDLSPVMSGRGRSSFGWMKNWASDTATSYRTEKYAVKNHFTENEDGNSYTEMMGWLGQKDIAIWIHAGHGWAPIITDSFGRPMRDGGDLSIGSPPRRYAPAVFSVHHKLARVELRSCYAGQKWREWLNLVAEYGTFQGISVQFGSRWDWYFLSQIRTMEDAR